MRTVYKRWAYAIAIEEFPPVSAITREAFSLLDAGAPGVFGEIRALLEEVVFAKGEAGEKITFHGISWFCLWGAIILNAEGHKTTLEVLQTLAHGSSHIDLFGVALDSPLVLNEGDERYSPRRCDPRPMDGIYLSVPARMHYALTHLLASPTSSPPFRRKKPALPASSM
jgi:HEXXH motif-containing protein